MVYLYKVCQDYILYIAPQNEKKNTIISIMQEITFINRCSVY